jgi:nucleoid-associated protein YejK
VLLSEENRKIRDAILDFDQQIEQMHAEFHKYFSGKTKKRPDWEKLEKRLINFSRKKIIDFGLSTQLDKVLYKFQNRKRIWLSWIG